MTLAHADQVRNLRNVMANNLELQF
jgi:hypothetical protein